MIEVLTNVMKSEVFTSQIYWFILTMCVVLDAAFTIKNLYTKKGFAVFYILEATSLIMLYCLSLKGEGTFVIMVLIYVIATSIIQLFIASIIGFLKEVQILKPQKN